jgi:hypothetical protein
VGELKSIKQVVCELYGSGAVKPERKPIYIPATPKRTKEETDALIRELEARLGVSK